jgi:hypothetical protein
MPATPLRAQLSDEELMCHEHPRSARRRTLSDPASIARALRWPSARSRPGCVGQPAGTDLPA